MKVQRQLGDVQQLEEIFKVSLSLLDISVLLFGGIDGLINLLNTTTADHVLAYSR